MTATVETTTEVELPSRADTDRTGAGANPP